MACGEKCTAARLNLNDTNSMNKIKFCEALYALCEGIVVCRRKSIIFPVLLILVGAILFAFGSLVGDDGAMVDLRSSLVMAGIVVAVAGAVWLLFRMAGKGEPYHKQKRAFLRNDVLSFDRAQRAKVLEAIDNGDYAALVKLPRREVSALAVMVYALPDGSFAAAQAFEYAELEYRPICEVKILAK